VFSFFVSNHTILTFPKLHGTQTWSPSTVNFNFVKGNLIVAAALHYCCSFCVDLEIRWKHCLWENLCSFSEMMAHQQQPLW